MFPIALSNESNCSLCFRGREKDGGARSTLELEAIFSLGGSLAELDWEASDALLGESDLSSLSSISLVLRFRGSTVDGWGYITFRAFLTV